MPEPTDAELDQLIKAIGLKRPRGGSERKPIAHGTYRGARQHYYRKEPLCEPCRLAHNAYQNERYRVRAQAKGYLTEEQWQARQNGGAA
ncbi:hypothetical protein [Streptomyces sp. OM5714]|uniref:hypothetical protein n=1 Tax=Streptomyces sp. OM5714 TaxID=2602736 RepID=UPI0013D971CE|nr:hypothetical protein [Streptomyces sp. OM5714]KAF2774673.1 hypothetical protein STPH1_7718 [Streptomyces sp. OM5714]